MAPPDAINAASRHPLASHPCRPRARGVNPVASTRTRLRFLQ